MSREFNRLSVKKVEQSVRETFCSKNGRFETCKLILEQIKSDDIDFFKSLCADTGVFKYFSQYKSWLIYGIVFEQFQKEIVQKQSGTEKHLIIRDKNEVPIGLVSLYFMGQNTWLVEYSILKKYQRKGFMNETLNAIMNNLELFKVTFELDVAINQLVFEIDNRNVESQGLLKKVAKNNNLNLEVSQDGFFDFLKGNPGEEWYRIKLC